MRGSASPARRAGGRLALGVAGDSFSVPAALRIPFIRRCQLDLPRGEQTSFMLDLSLSGAYVECRELLAVRDSTVLSFRVPGNDRLLHLPSVVIWVNSTQAHPVHSLPPGCGLRFVEVPETESRLISRAILDYCLKHPLYRQYL